MFRFAFLALILVAQESPAAAVPPGAGLIGPATVRSSEFGDRMLSEEHASALFGATAGALSPPFPVYLWDDFILPIAPGVGISSSASFQLALAPGLRPPATYGTGVGISPGFTVSTSGLSPGGLSGEDRSPSTTIYLAEGFQAPQAARIGEENGPAFALTLAQGFNTGGNIAALNSTQFSLYLDRSFSGTAIGSTGSAVGVAFVVRLATVSETGLMATAASPGFVLFLGTDRRLPRDGFSAFSSSASFPLGLHAPAFSSATQALVGQGSSIFFEAYLVAGFIRPLPAQQTASSSLAFELTLVAVPSGRFGFALSAPFELDLGRPTPVLVSVVRVEYLDGAARIAWYSSEASTPQFLVQRSADEASWSALTTITPDPKGMVNLEDRAVRPGRRYGYRLTGETFQGSVGEVWLDVPAFVLSLAGAVPNPTTRNHLVVWFTLPDISPAWLEVLDIAGRRVTGREVGQLGPGAHSVDLVQGRPIHAGIYFVRLTTPSRSLLRKASILD